MSHEEASVRSIVRIVCLILGVILLLIGVLTAVEVDALSEESILEIVLGVVLIVISRFI